MRRRQEPPLVAAFPSQAAGMGPAAVSSYKRSAMSLMSVGPGPDFPDVVNVIIEIPAQTGPVKYEVDKYTGAVFVDRFMATSMFYPCNYGYVSQTLGQDGDPVDVLVITPHPLLPGTVIPCRMVGMLRMEDESGGDAKLLAVPADHLTRSYLKVRDVHDVAPELLASIEHFFVHYKDLEPGKWVKTQGWTGCEDALAELRESALRYRDEGK